MESPVTVRPARVEDAAAMGRMHVRSWQETYRGLMPDRVLDDPGHVDARERFWTAALVDERHRANRIAVAERDGAVIGVAMAVPPESPEPGWSLHLCVLYVLAADQGSGAGAALLDAVVGPHESAALWVADPIRGRRRSTVSTDSSPTALFRWRTVRGRSAWCGSPASPPLTQVKKPSTSSAPPASVADAPS